MKILFVGGMYPKEYEDYFKSNMKSGGFQSAANTFQWAVIKGLYENQADFNVVSFPSLPCFPKGYSVSQSPCFPIITDGVKVGTTLKYNTTLVIKDYSIRRTLKQYLKRWVEANKNQDLMILAYSPQSSILDAIISTKERYPQVKFCNIIADLVDDATNPVFHLSFPKYVQARIEQVRIHKSYTFTDKFVLLSEAMSEMIPQARGNHIVVEGISGDIDNNPVSLKDNNNKTLLYTGTIQKFAGVLDLIEAFKMTSDKNYRLVICGSGVDSSEMLQMIKGDDRIEYKGMVSRDEAVRLQKQATLLVNPRKPSVSLTRYSFPSKTMEYLVSGTPMLGYHLDGIPSEYYEYFFSPEDDSNESLAETIERVFGKSTEELAMFAAKAKQFVVENKSSKAQVYRMLNYLQA